MINIIRRLRRMTSGIGQKWADRERKQQKVRLYSKFLRRGELCFDVGANIGNRTEAFLEIGARVVAVEPQAECARILREKFHANPNFTLIEAALGDSEREADMLISNANVLSSLSSEWVQTVMASGRFAGYNWDRKQKVTITTLDHLVMAYGEPAFVKIDVEGFEYQVLRGLSRPVRSLSFEFVPEFGDAALRVISHLQSLGNVEFNYSLGESMVLELTKWVSGPGLVDILKGFGADSIIFGDVYARFLKETLSR